MRQEGRNPDFFNRRNWKKRGKRKGKWGPPFSHKAPNATIQIPELFRLAGGERNSHHADITIILLHTWWTHRCRDLLRRYQWAQIPTDLTRNPYHKQDDTGMFQKVLIGTFSIGSSEGGITPPTKCLVLSLSHSISTDEKAKAGIVLSESEIVYHTKIPSSSWRVLSFGLSSTVLQQNHQPWRNGRTEVGGVEIQKLWAEVMGEI